MDIGLPQHPHADRKERQSRRETQEILYIYLVDAASVPFLTIFVRKLYCTKQHGRTLEYLLEYNRLV